MIQDLLEFFSSVLSHAGTFNAGLVFALFLVGLISEGAGLSFPYLLETIWLMAGYNATHGSLSPLQLLVLILTAQIGRQGGMLVLYFLSSKATTFLSKRFKRFKWDASAGETITFKGGRKVKLLSPFSVAVGRLLWARIPLTLILGAKKKLKVLSLAVVISSLVYDGTFFIFGAVVGTATKLQPVQMTLLFLATLTVVYAINFAIRRLIRLVRGRRKAGTPGVS